ncbi:MAG: DnaJ family molecular chaperone [Rhodobiaceae bacterium]|nr:DnaJ family molecular chaperone [Rhodobiaceae bacterium]
MTVWSRIGDAVSRVISTEAAGRLVERIATLAAGAASRNRDMAFWMALIALSAKMARADGVVTHDERRAFGDIFSVEDGDRAHVERVFELAERDVAGFEAYARQIAEAFGEDRQMLEDVLDGLFHIAKADGLIHEKELEFIANVADIFRVDEVHFDRILARHVHPNGIDPYAVLGLPASAPFDEVRKRYRALAAESHPDRLRARGVPEEFLTIANDRMAALNDAYAVIEKARAAA